MSGIEVALLAGTALSAVGAVAQGNQQARQFREAAAVNRYNAEVAERDARQAQITALSRQEVFRQQARRELGRQRAAQAESGLAMAGTALGVLDRSAIDSELDALAIGHEGELEARAFRQRAGLDRFEAAANVQNARTARTSGWVSAGASVLGGVADAYQWRRFEKARQTTTPTPSPQAAQGSGSTSTQSGPGGRVVQRRGNQTPSHGR